MATNGEVRRYSDEALAEFKVIVEQKLQNAQEQLQKLQLQILEVTENTADEYGGDWVDDSSVNNEMEMLNNMAIRQRKYVQDLQNALLRIKNKTYGICVVTGELIDRRRLMAVPTTTKSLEAKSSLYKENEEKLSTVRLTDTPYVRGQEPLKPKEPRVAFARARCGEAPTTTRPKRSRRAAHFEIGA